MNEQNMRFQSDFVLKSLAALHTETRLCLVGFQMTGKVFEALSTCWTGHHIFRQHVLMDLPHVEVKALPRVKGLATHLAHVGPHMAVHKLDVNRLLSLRAMESPQVGYN